tara:strand:+ start:355 stop:966 length:612 start_codon:yes stop_codon:yes gene_type:complete
MDIKQVNIEDLIPYEKNPRKNLNVDKVANSIKEFGFQQPIVVDKNMVIIVGHTRFGASQKLGLKTVPVLIADISPKKAKAYRIADNKLNEDSSWDYNKLNKEFTDLLDINYDLLNLGFGEEELEKIITFEPKFEATNDIIEDIDEGGIEAPTSQVRMVQLFLNSQTEPEFKKLIEFLQKEYGTDNLTDTVFAAIQNEKNNLTS